MLRLSCLECPELATASRVSQELCNNLYEEILDRARANAYIAEYGTNTVHKDAWSWQRFRHY